jgi:hypothetical protein
VVAARVALPGLAGIPFVSPQKRAGCGGAACRDPAGFVSPEPDARGARFRGYRGDQRNLDLVIAVDTSVAHLAGALEQPVWILLRFDGYWRWLQDRGDSPWYPGVVRLYLQKPAGDWGPMIDWIAQGLAGPAV